MVAFCLLTVAEGVSLPVSLYILAAPAALLFLSFGSGICWQLCYPRPSLPVSLSSQMTLKTDIYIPTVFVGPLVGIFSLLPFFSLLPVAKVFSPACDFLLLREPYFVFVSFYEGDYIIYSLTENTKIFHMVILLQGHKDQT